MLQTDPFTAAPYLKFLMLACKNFNLTLIIQSYNARAEIVIDLRTYYRAEEIPQTALLVYTRCRENLKQVKRE